MRFVCDSCRAQYMISDDKVGPKGVKVRCKKCSYVILVRKAQDAAAAPAAGPAIDEERDETQVMQNPLANLGSQINDELTNPGASTQEQKNKDNLLGASDDEIGAVFDSVLNSGTHPVGGADKDEGTPTQGGAALGDDGDDRMSTRVLDAEVMKKLAAEAENGAGGESKPAEKNGKHAEAKPAAAAAEHDWYVAIDEKQVGPLKKEGMKEKWDSGEIGPDSLCWRAGFSDWIPLSEAAELASVLAPRPAKPIIVSNGPSAPAPSVVTVPVESAFNSGGVTRTVRSEVPVPMAASGATSEEPTGWKPSAASALASLVKEEIDALTRPAPVEAKSPVNGEGASVLPGGLLDLPPDEPRSNGKPAAPSLLDSAMDAPAPAPAPVRPSNGANAYAQQPMAPPMAPQYAPQPYAYQPPPQPSGNRTLLIVGGAVVVLLLLVVVGVVVWAVSRNPAAPQPAYVAQVQPQVEQKQAEPVKQQPVVEQKQQPVQQQAAVAQNTQTDANKTAENKVEAKKEEPVAKNEPKEEVKEEKAPKLAMKETTRKSHNREESNDSAVIPAKATQTPKEEKSTKKVEDATGSDDEFAREFGGGDTGSKKKVAAPPPEEESPKKKNVYIPPAPGSGENVPDTISQSQVVEVVVGSKDAIKKCVMDQKAKNPAVGSGTIVMKWTVTPSGKASQVSCQSDQYKSEYLAGCLGGVIKGMSFPKHKSAQDPIVFPFKF